MSVDKKLAVAAVILVVFLVATGVGIALSLFRGSTGQRTLWIAICFVGYVAAEGAIRVLREKRNSDRDDLITRLLLIFGTTPAQRLMTLSVWPLDAQKRHELRTLLGSVPSEDAVCGFFRTNLTGFDAGLAAVSTSRIEEDLGQVRALQKLKALLGEAGVLLS